MRGLGVAMAGAVVAGLLTAGAAATATPVTAPTLTQASNDAIPTNNTGTTIQNVTQVETDTFAWGSTVVAAFQVGRTSAGFGAAAIGWSTSTDSGQSWSHGLLPGLTTSSPNPDPANYPLVVNQSVAYDARDGEWLIPSVTYLASGSGFHEKALLVNRSASGTSWSAPITAVSTNVDKAWGVCDNTSTSPFYGRCYVAYSQLDSADALAVVTSADAGATWSPPVLVPDGVGGNATGYNVNPVVRPDGTVVVVATDVNNGLAGSKLLSFTSTDGGATWSQPIPFATVQRHEVTGVRALNKPTADVDAAGQVTAVWSDCRFAAACATNDLVMSTSPDGTTWTQPRQLPLQPTSGDADQFDPGVAVAPGTSGSTAQVSVVYYTFTSCATTPPCLDADYATSYDGGQTWSSAYPVNPTPMPISWFAASPRTHCLPGTVGTTCRMVGDYNSVSFLEGGAVTVLPLAASAPVGGTFDETEWGLALPPGFLRPPDPSPGPPPPAVPDTTITRHPKAKVSTHKRRAKVTFAFRSSLTGAGFECRRDAGVWKPCESAVTYKARKGRHTFAVRATNAGLVDPTPARFAFRVRTLKSDH